MVGLSSRLEKRDGRSLASSARRSFRRYASGRGPGSALSASHPSSPVRFDRTLMWWSRSEPTSASRPRFCTRVVACGGPSAGLTEIADRGSEHAASPAPLDRSLALSSGPHLDLPYAGSPVYLLSENESTRRCFFGQVCRIRVVTQNFPLLLTTWPARSEARRAEELRAKAWRARGPRALACTLGPRPPRPPVASALWSGRAGEGCERGAQGQPRSSGPVGPRRRS